MVGMIISIVCGAIGVLCLIIKAGRACGPWGLILGFIGAAGALVGFIVVTMDGTCFDSDSDAILAVSAYAAIIGGFCFLIGGVGSCGASKYEN